MNDNLKEKVKCTIPIKVDYYEGLFREYDSRDAEYRCINEDLNGWLQEYIFQLHLPC